MKPIMADLPEFRVEDSQPIFSNTGVDVFGPIYIKQRKSKIKKMGIFVYMSEYKSNPFRSRGVLGNR